MAWYVYLAYFGAGLFLTNSLPHFIRGVSGEKFQSPFASPPGVGESSPLINVVWGLLNFIAGYLLLTAVGDFRLGLTLDSLLVALGMLVMGMFCASHFGKVRGNA